MLSSLSYFVFSGFRFFFYSIGSEDSSSVRKQSLFLLQQSLNRIEVWLANLKLTFLCRLTGK